ncbi:MAG: flavin-dependent oxidoreductase [Ilumatobacter sp.]|nr:flavin-dependent oxidoreductase [Ilumatobacter sp.]
MTPGDAARGDGTVLIAGGGIAGLTLALTCHQIGVPARVFESVRELGPLGVGINLQPNAVRELIDLGLGDALPSIGIEAREWALVGRNGNDVWSEPRGLAAGYRWPQYAVHRGELQMLLYRTVLERLGPDAVVTSRRVVGYETGDGVGDAVRVTLDRRDGAGGTERLDGALLVACDGLHSAVRAQMYPGQGDPHWGGAVLWRGTALGRPIRSGSSFTLVGSLDQRFVHYPIGEVDPATGLQLQNWICEMTVDPDRPIESNWNAEVSVDTFLPAFEGWRFGWLDVPDLVRRAERVWEFPMVDRDPVDRWVDDEAGGRVALAGDAAHVMYPVGSNGASQAIVDARVIGAKFVEHGVGPEALLAYEEALLDDISALVLRNRGAGPIALLGVVDERCGGVFDDIDDVMPRAEREAFMERYKAAAGFAKDALNAAPPTIEPGARVA